MKNSCLPLLFSIVFSVMSCNSDDGDPVQEHNEGSGAVSYAVTFDASWSMETHPNMFPGSAHFSGLIGMTHKDGIRLFRLNEISTPGIKSMAETGSKTALRAEIEALVSLGEAEFVIDGPGVGSSPGKAMVGIELNPSHPFVSITSMIAPSPDWFIAVSNINLYESGEWVKELEVEVGTYDAGTDSGPTYSSPNEVTEPFEPIAEITDGPLETFGTVPVLGTMKFVRTE